MDIQEELRKSVALAVRRSAATLKTDGPLFGFALATDDDVRTLYHVACTVDWVRENELSYPYIGFIFVEWPDSAHDDLFSPISSRLATLSNQTSIEHAAWSSARDQRFNALVLALKDCRDAGIFDEETLLVVGSTDPSEHLQALEMQAATLLNRSKIISEYARAIGSPMGST